MGYRLLKISLLAVLFILVKPPPATAQTTYYFSPVFEKTDGKVTKYYPLPGNAAAMRKDGELTYLHSDHLSSTRLVTNQQGTVNSQLDYYPYGSLYLSTSELSTSHLYTNQILDSSTDLYFYHARQYNPRTASFISADSAQGPNRYAYVAGNPIISNDPYGQWPHKFELKTEAIYEYKSLLPMWPYLEPTVRYQNEPVKLEKSRAGGNYWCWSCIFPGFLSREENIYINQEKDEYLRNFIKMINEKVDIDQLKSLKKDTDPSNFNYIPTASRELYKNIRYDDNDNSFKFFNKIQATQLGVLIKSTGLQCRHNAALLWTMALDSGINTHTVRISKANAWGNIDPNNNATNWAHALVEYRDEEGNLFLTDPTWGGQTWSGIKEYSEMLKKYNIILDDFRLDEDK